MRLHDLPTPAAIVDLARVERNCRRMRERAAALRVRLRPHVKTHKTVAAARLAVGAETGPITVSTFAEAEFFATAGFGDITYAVPLAPQRVAAVARLAARIERLTVLVDGPAAIDALEAARGHVFDVMLKVDCGYHRAGVDPASDVAVTLAQRLAASPSCRFRGLLAHAGHAYACPDRAALLRVAAEERDVTATFAATLRARGIDVPEVSIGSTPTMSVAEDLPGGLAEITEIRPGNYVFFDGFQAALGTCTTDDCAFTVLATVIACHAARDAIVLDAGALALSKDPGAAHLAGWDGGHGALLDPLSGAPLPLVLHALSQEHGLVCSAPGPSGGSAALARLAVGDRVRILPNHSCLTAALFDRYDVADGDEIVAEWRPCRGW